MRVSGESLKSYLFTLAEIWLNPKSEYTSIRVVKCELMIASHKQSAFIQVREGDNLKSVNSDMSSYYSLGAWNVF